MNSQIIILLFIKFYGYFIIIHWILQNSSQTFCYLNHLFGNHFILFFFLFNSLMVIKFYIYWTQDILLLLSTRNHFSYYHSIKLYIVYVLTTYIYFAALKKPFLKYTRNIIKIIIQTFMISFKLYTLDIYPWDIWDLHTMLNKACRFISYPNQLAKLEESLMRLSLDLSFGYK